ncbi:hypothetical protein EJ08DRAFT_657828 [Tothia fuscella]|uniref:RING-type domain-containing protein n=1 Tax=Tothia fuscella TaxID=1048955 RepID=A0A9P4NWL4_9PEZI|nr:hypothetical protein EJ08DRAFT_657828 [Tothia fuscella]
MANHSFPWEQFFLQSSNPGQVIDIESGSMRSPASVFSHFRTAFETQSNLLQLHRDSPQETSTAFLPSGSAVTTPSPHSISDRFQSPLGQYPPPRASHPLVEARQPDTANKATPGKSVRKPIEGDCAVCWDPFEATQVIIYCKTTCGHNFHRACFVDWVTAPKNRETPSTVSCPMCRGPWDEDELRQIQAENGIEPIRGVKRSRARIMSEMRRAHRRRSLEYGRTHRPPFTNAPSPRVVSTPYPPPYHSSYHPPPHPFPRPLNVTQPSPNYAQQMIPPLLLQQSPYSLPTPELPTHHQTHVRTQMQQPQPLNSQHHFYPGSHALQTFPDRSPQPLRSTGFQINAGQHNLSSLPIHPFHHGSNLAHPSQLNNNQHQYNPLNNGLASMPPSRLPQSQVLLAHMPQQQPQQPQPHLSHIQQPSHFPPPGVSHFQHRCPAMRNNSALAGSANSFPLEPWSFASSPPRYEPSSQESLPLGSHGFYRYQYQEYTTWNSNINF